MCVHVSDTEPSGSSKRKVFPLITFSVHIKREWGFYFWNMFMILMFLVTMSGAVRGAFAPLHWFVVGLCSYWIRVHCSAAVKYFP